MFDGAVYRVYRAVVKYHQSSLYALLSKSQRAVDEANGIVRSKRDAFVDTVLNQLKGMTDDGLTFGQYAAEISVVNRKRAVFLEFSPDIGRTHSSDAGSTCFGQWALQLADDPDPVLCADPLSVSLPNCFGA